jgi:uncharacterized membrane protein
MGVFILGLLIFFAVHSVSIVNEPWRNRMVAKMGEQPWQGVYALVAVAGFVLIVWGYGLARADPVLLYSPPMWLRHVALLLLLPVFPLLLAAYLPGRPGGHQAPHAGCHKALGRSAPARQRHAG